MRLVLAALCGVFVLSGCATRPLSFAESSPVGQSKVVDVGTGSATVMVKRDSGFSGAACDTQVFINGVLRAMVGPSEYVTLYAAPGPAIIGVAPHGICGGNLKEIAANFSNEHPNKFRISIDQTLAMSIGPTATD